MSLHPRTATIKFVVALLLITLVRIHAPTLAFDCDSFDFNHDTHVNAIDASLVDQNHIDANGDGVFNEDDKKAVLGCVVGTAPDIPAPQLPDSPTKNFTQGGFVGELVSTILPVVLGLGGFITVIIIVISGIQFITSSGNPESAAGARNRLTFAIVGFIIIILAFAITQIVDKIFLGGSGII